MEVNCQKPVSFEIEADDNIVPLIQTEVRNGVLHVSTTKSYMSSRGIVLRITVPDLASVKSTGAGKFHVSDVKTTASKSNRRAPRRCLPLARVNP